MPITAPELQDFLLRAERLIARFERLFPAEQETDWEGIAWRWQKGALTKVSRPHRISLDDLIGVERQKKLLEDNMVQFLSGHPANNALLTGARGTGKSSLVKALLDRYCERGLRLIEVEKKDLLDLPEIIDRVACRPERFLLFCDDLSFDAEEPGYQALKAALDGSIAAPPENMLIYATSNRRHLLPEYMSENLETKYRGDEIHPGETVEEKISLSERFGLWVSFYPFSQEEYLAIVSHWLDRFGIENREGARQAALQWALHRGSRSGRIAWQFSKDWAGKART